MVYIIQHNTKGVHYKTQYNIIIVHSHGIYFQVWSFPPSRLQYC